MAGEQETKAPVDKDRSKTEKIFEASLYDTRFIILIAVIGCIIAAVITFVMGAMFIIQASTEFFMNIGKLTEAIEEEVLVKFISSIDLFLFGIILIILSMGSYDLFISKLDPAYEAGATPNWIKFKDVNEMKEPLLHVIIIILVITFFKYIIRYHYASAYELMIIPLGIALIGIGLFLINKADVKKEVKG